MKKVFRVLLIFIGVIILIAAIGATYISIDGIPKYKRENVPAVTVISSPEKIANGKRLATVLCATCHLNAATQKLTGERMYDAPAEFGTVWSQNITQDKEYGIGDWSDADLVYLLRTGVKKNGFYAPPWMAKLPHMADDDINDILAFLHSDDPWVQPAAVEDTAPQPSFLAKFLCHVAFKPFPYPDHRIERPDTNNKVEWGHYIATSQVECYSCHSRDFKTVDFYNPEKSEGFFGGGNGLRNKQQQTIHSANLTSDKETGIGNWTEDQFVKTVRFGLKPDGTSTRYPMIPFVQLTNSEVRAVYAYLKTLPPIHNQVDRTVN